MGLRAHLRLKTQYFCISDCPNIQKDQFLLHFSRHVVTSLTFKACPCCYSFLIYCSVDRTVSVMICLYLSELLG